MALMNNSLVLTAHNRLARWLMLERNEQQKQKKAWETPNILSLSAWLKKTWLKTWPEKYLLSKIQSEVLWEKIVHSDSSAKQLGMLHKKAAAAQAANAYSLIKEYKIPVKKEAFQETIETHSFLKWLEIYETQLSQWNAIDESALIDWISNFIDENKIDLPSTISFKGFQKKTPQLQVLLDSLERKNIKIQLNFLDGENTKVVADYESTNISAQNYDDKSEEAITCARWVRSNYQPGKRFGIIVPDLKSYRSLLHRELAAELCPESIYPEKKMELPFNISMGSPLSQTTPINLILQTLSTASCDIPAGIFYSVIKTPIFNLNRDETLALELELRKQMKFTVDINSFTLDRKDAKLSQLRNLFAALKFWILEKNHFLPSEWAKRISSFLESINWPDKEEKLTEKENSIFESWKNCLDQLASLNSILGKVERLEAVKNLKQIAEKCFFPEKNRDHLIQVIKLSESTGMKFDYIWVMGCHSDALPPSPEPNTLIPAEHRKKYQLPHSNAKWELESCESYLDNLISNSSEIIFSYPSQEGDNVLEPSPLIKNFQKIDPLDLPSERLKDKVSNATALETYFEDSHLPLTENEKIRFDTGQEKMGSSLFKYQADCPFQAFSRIRLNAVNRDIPETDWGPMIRGKLVHRILEIFWRKVQTKANLFDLHETGKLTPLLTKIVQQAMEEAFRNTPNQFEFFKLEKSRNINLIMEWLTKVELKRDDFTVLGQEKKGTLKLEGISLSLRVDRIDQTADNEQVLIDYKTGEANPGEWLTERLLSPQLPLYANLLSPTGVLFAQIKKEEMRLKGVQNSSANTKKSSIDYKGFKKSSKFSEIIGENSWNNLLSYWKNKTDLLANEFLSGRLSIEPALKQNTCRNCDLKSFCRIWEDENAMEET